eukprot:243486-Pyramimonas_sp.AAC.1
MKTYLHATGLLGPPGCPGRPQMTSKIAQKDPRTVPEAPRQAKEAPCVEIFTEDLGPSCGHELALTP